MKRAIVAAGAALVMAVGFGQPVTAFEPDSVECIAPASPGGGWDFTCRAVGRVLYELGMTPGPVQVTNMSGGGGGVAFAHVVSERNDDNNLLVAASMATATRLAQQQYPGVNADMVRWLGTVGADYGILVVSADSEMQNLDDFVAALKEDASAISVAGGSAPGGFDHIKVLLAARAGGFDDITAVKYISFDSGGVALTQLLGGHVQVVTGDVSEVIGNLRSGDVRALAIFSEQRLPGDLADVPTAVEQGYDVVAANWRGFYLPGGISDDAYDYWAQSLADLYDSDAWKATMDQSGLMPFSKHGEAFDTFVRDQMADVEALSREIGIIE